MENDEISQNIQNQLNNIVFKKLIDQKIKSKGNNLLTDLENDTIKIFSFLEDKIKQFPELFEKNLLTIKDTIIYLKTIEIPYNRECAGVIDNIPGWRCEDCTDYKHSIYCSKCFLKSKQLHKGHKIVFLPNSHGMCDCGDPNSFTQFCPDHKGPFTEQKQIDEFIEKSFPPKILSNLKIFLDDLFLQFSKYLILAEQCNFFCIEIYENNIHDQTERDDIVILNVNFCNVLQNFLNFLYIMTFKNIGMLYLISNYLLNNHFSLQDIEEKYKTVHTCIKLENKKIQILYENKNNNINIFSLINKNDKETHKCECSFLRLLLSNWRDEVKCQGNQNDEFLISFAHNLFFKDNFTLLYFFLYKDIMLNDNPDILSNRGQFATEENIILINEQTDLLIEHYKIFYEYIKGMINSQFIKDKNGGFNPQVMSKFLNKFKDILSDFHFFCKAKIKEIIGSKKKYL